MSSDIIKADACQGQGEFKTISKGSTEFNRYLYGERGDGFRALPIRSLNVFTDQETVTYRLVNKEQIHRPLFYFLDLLKPRVLLAVLVPMFYLVISYIKSKSPFHPMSTSSAVVGVLLAVLAGTLKNDFIDHMTGLDRLLPVAQQRPIQKGWVSPWKVLRLSQWFLFLAVLCGGVIAAEFPHIIFVLVIAVTLIWWNQFQEAGNFKFRLRGEFAIALLFGPILSLGFWTAVSGELFQWRVLAFGMSWGFFVHFLVHLQNFSTAMWASQFKFKNTMTRLGFDRSRWFLSMWFIGSLLFYFLFEAQFGSPTWGGVALATFSLPVFHFFKMLLRLKSPLSSAYLGAAALGYKLLLGFEFFLFIRAIFI